MELEGFDFGEQQPENSDVFEEPLTNKPDNSPSDSEGGNQPQIDYMATFLKSKGIDSNNIPITGEDGTTEIFSFDNLSDEEKLSILESTYSEPAITDDEINTINFLRQNKVSLNEYVKGQIDKAIQEYTANNKNTVYTTDQYSDEELFKFELSETYPDLTEEEIEDEYQRALGNPELFKKKVDALRRSFKEYEDNQEKATREQQEAENAQQWEEMASSIVDYARNTPYLHGLELSDDDKNEVLSFLLEKDVNGNTEFYKRCNDPKFLFNLAWYTLKGDEAFKAVEDYYKGLLTKARRTNNPTKVVYRNKPKQTDPFDLDSFYNKK